MKQLILTAENHYAQLEQYLQKANGLFLVCGSSIGSLKIGAYLEELPRRLGIPVIKFSDFHPNPSWESVAEGVEKFRGSGCNMIAAVGGGSAIDVAKCIKLWYTSEKEGTEIGPLQGEIPLLAVPTTAGSGSEATRFAVIYRQGRKQSITDERCLPSAVCFDPGALDTLPLYHKKAAMLDALCHGIESFWSINSTQESQAYSYQAIQMILNGAEDYLRQGRGAPIQQAAYLAGQAINIAQTTAGHAMSYSITSQWGIAHGHAAALCVAALWPYMLAHMEDCVDSRGERYLAGILQKIASAMFCATSEQAAERFCQLMKLWGMAAPAGAKPDLDALASAVAPERLKNHPIRLDRTAIHGLYEKIFCSV